MKELAIKILKGLDGLKGIIHLTQVMSVLGNAKALLHTVYNIWLVVCGITLLISNFKVYMIVSKSSHLIATLLFIVIMIYAIDGCILLYRHFVLHYSPLQFFLAIHQDIQVV